MADKDVMLEGTSSIVEVNDETRTDLPRGKAARGLNSTVVELDESDEEESMVPKAVTLNAVAHNVQYIESSDEEAGSMAGRGKFLGW